MVFSCVLMWVHKMTQLMRPDDQDKRQSADTVKHFPGMVTAATLCFATKYASFSARSQAHHTSNHVSDELPVPRASQNLWCRHGCHGSWCNGTLSAVGESWRGSASQRWDVGWSHSGVSMLPPVGTGWSLAEVWLDFGDQVLTPTGNCAPQCELFP